MKTLDQFIELNLSRQDLEALARQGSVAAERKGSQTRLKLRFRVDRVQRVRCLGTDLERAAAIQAALQAWQRARHSRRELKKLEAAGRALRRDIRRRLVVPAAQAGFKLHGRQLRRPRAVARAVPPAATDPLSTSTTPG